MDYLPSKCPVTYALAMLNGKWKLPIVWILAQHEPVRFNELQRQLGGISNLMLSKSLQELEQYKLVHRQQYNEIPPRVEYTLTPLGKELTTAFEKLALWGEQARAEVGEFWREHA